LSAVFASWYRMIAPLNVAVEQRLAIAHAYVANAS